jgi:HD-GYP domain-containing protein (c-di-GMP phosphodiesterase class II)
MHELLSMKPPEELLLEQARQHPELQEAFKEPYVTALLRPLAKEVPWKALHSVDVALITVDLVGSLNYSPQRKLEIIRAAILHDIGTADNSALPLAITNKVGSLTDEEFRATQTHPGKAYERIIPYSVRVAEIAVGHHAHQGRRSYPEFALTQPFSEEVIQDQRIIAMADVIHALFDPSRPYKKPWDSDAVGELVDSQFGKWFSPKLRKKAVESGLKRVAARQANKG